MTRKSWLSWTKARPSEDATLRSHAAPFGIANRSLPESDKWTLSEFVVHRLVPIVGVRPYPVDEQLFMCSTVSYFDPDLIVEWGTHLGVSARIFYEATRLLGRETAIHSVDLPPDAVHEENVAAAENRARFVRGLAVTLHEGDGITVARDVYAAAKPERALFFLDGDHAYETVRRELLGVRSLASSAAVLLHDTFNQTAASGYNIGPYRALTEFAAGQSLPVYHTALGLPGMSLVHW